MKEMQNAEFRMKKVQRSHRVRASLISAFRIHNSEFYGGMG